MDIYTGLHLPFELSNMPVSAMAADYQNGHFIESHRHQRAQLLYAIEGVMLIETEEGRWVVPPTRGVWLEANVAHTVSMRGNVKMRTVFIDAGLSVNLPKQSCVLNISPLLRELILEAVRIPLSYDIESRDGLIIKLLLEELSIVPILPLYLPWPTDSRLRMVCDHLAVMPNDSKTISAWAQELAMAEVTFQRQFQQHIGMTFGRWRQQARLLLALEKLAKGEKIITVAADHGYSSQSAFTAMFKRHFGMTPSLFYK